MPELPEVEIVRRGLERLTLNQFIVGGDVLLDRTIAHPISVNDFLAGLRGSAIAGWQRRGKYLLAQLIRQSSENSQRSQGGWLGVHLRMTGQLLWLNQDEPLQKHTRVRLFFAENRELRFVDQRTFGQMWWIAPQENYQQVMKGLGRLGPEPFSPEFTATYFAEQLRPRRRAIKSALLDQVLVAGIGNIYADEALFRSGIAPITLCSELTLEQVERLHIAIQQVLQASLSVGGTTFSDFRDVQGINGNYGGEAWVYNRYGEPCRLCSTPIERLRLGGRSTHFCPQCQQS